MRWLLFDLDGTLVDTGEDILAATNHLLGQLGRKPLTRPQVLAHVGHGAAWLVAGVAPGLSPPDQAQALRVWQDYYLEHPADHSRVYPGVRELLAGLPAGVAAVVTNKHEEVSRRMLRHLGLAEFFVTILGGREDRPRKPDPAPFREAMAALGGEPDRTAMVGDGQPDMLGARAAGCVPLGVTWGFSRARDLQAWGAGRLLARPAEILDWWQES